MSLDAFKFIFWWEWAHRFLARMVGFAFAIPLVYFIFAASLAGRVVLEARRPVHARRPPGRDRLVHGQLRPRRPDRCQPLSPGAAPDRRVPHFRAAAVVGLDAAVAASACPTRATTRRTAMPRRRLVALIFLQVVLGALVAGMKAGLVAQHLAADGWTAHPLGAMGDVAVVSQPVRECAGGAVQPPHGRLRDRRGRPLARGVDRAQRQRQRRAILGARCWRPRSWRRRYWGFGRCWPTCRSGLGLAHQGLAAIVTGLAVRHLFVVSRPPA